VRNFVDVVGNGVAKGARIVSIGPVTSEAARDAGLEVAIEATQHDIDGLVEALLRDAVG
jgi:uroporphyrinogen III methyltransferase/synthase